MISNSRRDDPPIQSLFKKDAFPLFACDRVLMAHYGSKHVPLRAVYRHGESSKGNPQGQRMGFNSKEQQWQQWCGENNAYHTT